jgi:hypothetical protein
MEMSLYPKKNKSINQMKQSIKLAVICVLAYATVAQAQWSFKNKIKGNGKVVTEKRNTASYDQITVSGFYDVNLVAGEEGNITLWGEENLLSLIKIEVQDNILKIYTEKDKNIHTSQGKNITITVPFQTLNLVSLSGSGDIKTQNTIKSKTFIAKLSGSGDLNLDVEANHFEASLSGSGDISLKGKTEDFISKISGSGNIDASTLESKNVDISISGSGDSKVYCSETLKARVSGSGDIEYKGNPKNKDTKVRGSGEISKA